MATKETPPEKIGWGVAPKYVGALRFLDKHPAP